MSCPVGFGRALLVFGEVLCLSEAKHCSTHSVCARSVSAGRFLGSLPLRAQEQPSTIQQTLKAKHKYFLADDVYFRLEKQKNINYII